MGDWHLMNVDGMRPEDGEQPFLAIQLAYSCVLLLLTLLSRRIVL